MMLFENGKSLHFDNEKSFKHRKIYINKERKEGKKVT